MLNISSKNFNNDYPTTINKNNKKNHFYNNSNTPVYTPLQQTKNININSQQPPQKQPLIKSNYNLYQQTINQNPNIKPIKKIDSRSPSPNSLNPHRHHLHIIHHHHCHEICESRSPSPISNNNYCSNNFLDNSYATCRINNNSDLFYVGKSIPIFDNVRKLNSAALDQCITKLAQNKFNKIKQIENSYYLNKDKYNSNDFSNNISQGIFSNNFDNINSKNKNDFQQMKENLAKKYEMFSKISNDINKSKSYNPNNEKVDNNNNILDNNNELEIIPNDNINNSPNKKNSNNLNNIIPESVSFISSQSPGKNKDKLININTDDKNNNLVPNNFIQTIINDTDNNSDKNNNLSFEKKNNFSPNKSNELNNNKNSSYKEILNHFYYFINSLSQNFLGGQKLQDISYYLNNIEDLSRILNNLTNAINSKNSGDHAEYISPYFFKFPFVLSEIKEISFQIPEKNKLDQFNDIIKGMNEKCFSFQNPYSNNEKDNKKIFVNKINKPNNNNEVNLNDIDLDNERCIACLLGCNVSKRGYSPMRFNPFDNSQIREDDCGEMFENVNAKIIEKKELEKKELEKKEKEKNMAKSQEKNDIGNNKRNNKKNSKSKNKIPKK